MCSPAAPVLHQKPKWLGYPFRGCEKQAVLVSPKRCIRAENRSRRKNPSQCPVPDVQRVDVASLHHDMRATPTNANRMLATLSRMFAVAELWQMRPDGSNPCRNIKHFREVRRERFLSDEGIPPPGRGPERSRAGGIGRAVGDRRDPPADADGMAEGGDPDSAVGIRRSGPRRAAHAGVQDWGEDCPSGRPGD